MSVFKRAVFFIKYFVFIGETRLYIIDVPDCCYDFLGRIQHGTGNFIFHIHVKSVQDIPVFFQIVCIEKHGALQTSEIKEYGRIVCDQNVGYEVVSELPKEKHPSPMLSLNKTKDVDELVSWLGDKVGLLSWKMDGLTVVLTYEGGKLVKAVTRGNGEIGEVITPNAKTFVNLPSSINYKGTLTIRGEAIITYSDFEKINSEIEDVDAKYKNPRNLCSGSVRQLSSEITAKRHVRFYAFSMVDPEDNELVESFNNSFEKRFEYLKNLGFEVV